MNVFIGTRQRFKNVPGMAGGGQVVCMSMLEWLRFSCVLSTGNVEDGWWTYVIYDCKHLHRRLTMQLVGRPVSTSTVAVAFTSTATVLSPCCVGVCTS